jgi:hypothetical protein
MINVEAIRRRNGWRASARWIERLNRKRARVFRTAVLKSHLVKEIPEPVLAVGGTDFIILSGPARWSLAIRNHLQGDRHD